MTSHGKLTIPCDVGTDVGQEDMGGRCEGKGDTALLGSRAHAGLCPLSISCRDGIRCVRDAIGESAFEED